MTLAARVDALVKLGLDRYGEGDLIGALSEWEHALSLEPDDDRPAQYIEYVRKNFDLLEEKFREARAAAAVAEAAGVPFGVSLELSDSELDDDAYEALEVEDPAEAQLAAWIESAAVDEGWVLDDLGPAEPLPPMPGGAREPFGHGLDPLAEPVVGVDGGELGDGAVEVARDAARRDAAPVGERGGGGEPAAAGPAGADLGTLDLDDEPGASELELAGAAAFGSLELEEPAADEADFGELNDLLERPAAEPAAVGEGAPAHEAAPGQRDGDARDDEELEETVPGGEEPPPLPDRPSLSEEAIAAIEVAQEVSSADRQMAAVPGREVPSDFDLREVRRLDDRLRDDRIVEPDAVKDVRVTFHEIGTSEKTMPARPSQVDFSLPDDLELAPSGAARASGRPAIDLEEVLEETVERDSALGKWPLAFDDLAEDEQTRERSSLAARLGHDAYDDDDDDDDSERRPPTVDPALEAGGVILDDDLRYAVMDLEATREVRALPDDGEDDDDDDTRDPIGLALASELAVKGRRKKRGQRDAEGAVAVDAVRMEAIAAQIDREVEAGVPVEESEDDRTRRRVGALIERAEREAATGNFQGAVAALDLALDERPESAIAQKIVHRHRDLLFGIYEAFIGDDSARPVVALPMHEIALQELDSRAAFLLSRIDGSLSFEEVLDVAGMSRLEAYRHLCRLLLRGILEVR